MGFLSPTITLKFCVESYGFGQYVLRRFAVFEEPILKIPNDPFGIFPKQLFEGILNAGPFDVYPAEIPSEEELYSCLTGLPVAHGDLLLDKYQMDDIAIGEESGNPYVLVLGDRALYYDTDNSRWGDPIGGTFPHGEVFEGCALYPNMPDYVDTYYPSGLRYTIASQSDTTGFLTGVRFGRFMTTESPAAISLIQITGNYYSVAAIDLSDYLSAEGEEPMVSLRDGLNAAGLNPFVWTEPPIKFCACDVLPVGFTPMEDEDGDKPGIQRVFPKAYGVGMNIAGLMSVLGIVPVGMGLKWRVFG